MDNITPADLGLPDDIPRAVVLRRTDIKAVIRCPICLDGSRAHVYGVLRGEHIGVRVSRCSPDGLAEAGREHPALILAVNRDGSLA